MPSAVVKTKTKKEFRDLLALSCDLCRNGRPRSGQSAERRIWGRATANTETGCWEYQGNRNKAGYGTLHFEGKSVLASRLGWEILFGPIDRGLLVCHTCDNPCCVNPQHWFLGTHQQNREDAVQKGRAKNPSFLGTKNPAAKLTEGKVREARRVFALGDTTISGLAARYGVKRESMRDAIRGKNWRWL